MHSDKSDTQSCYSWTTLGWLLRLQKEWANSMKIIQYLGKKLQYPDWVRGDFPWERKVLTMPNKWLKAFQSFIQDNADALCDNLNESFAGTIGNECQYNSDFLWTSANTSSWGLSKYLLLNWYTSNAVFWKTNMQQCDVILQCVHDSWQSILESPQYLGVRKDIMLKKYIKEQFGIHVQKHPHGAWILTGICYSSGAFNKSDELHVSGSLNGHKVLSILGHQRISDVCLSHASYARLCFLG